MKQLSLLLIAAGISLSATAQHSPESVTLSDRHRCGFGQVMEKVDAPYASLLQVYRNGAGRATAKGTKSTGKVYDIPVVFHIVYSQATPTFNLHDSVILNQLEVLNKAFRKQHADTGNARSYFRPLSADAEIQFHLATKDPQGAPTTGITRTLSARDYFGSADFELDSMERIKKTAEGGIAPWPTNRYLNIWIGNLANGVGQLAVLGYGVPPLNPLPGNWPPNTAIELAGLIDGVVLQPHAIGSNNPLSAALQGLYTMGRATVHEVGHYLGLQHTFGGNDGNPATASCGALADDGLNDTPEQSTISFLNTACPADTKNSCGAGTTGDLPDMWENYMDYSRDACQVLFTNDQIAVMRSVLGAQRAGLTGGSPTAVANVAAPAALALYPNPAADRISVTGTGSVRRATVVNYLGQELMQWEGAAAGRKAYDIGSLPAGHYMLVLEGDDGRSAGRFSVVR